MCGLAVYLSRTVPSKGERSWEGLRGLVLAEIALRSRIGPNSQKRTAREAGVIQYNQEPNKYTLVEEFIDRSCVEEPKDQQSWACT